MAELVEQKPQWPWARKLGQILGWLFGWGWMLFCGGGGFGLIITRGPWPPTNGWFALFSGISACPLTACLLKKYTGIRLSGWARLALALGFIVLGRLVLKIEGRGPFLPNFAG